MEKEVLFIKPFIIYSENVRQSQPILAYYLKFYAWKKAGTIISKYQGTGEDVTYIQEYMAEWQSDLDQMKQQLGSALQNQQQCKQQIVDYILKIFAKCDHDERNDNYTKQTQTDFTMVSRYFEMLAVFGPLDADLNQKRVYSKAKALEVKKKLENPQQYPRNNQNNPSNAPSQNQANNNFGNSNNNFNSNNNNNNNNNNLNNNNQNNNISRQSVFNNVPQIINLNNIHQTANIANDVNMGNNFPTQPQPVPTSNQSNQKQNQPNNMFTPPTKHVQFANPYLNQAVGFNISFQDGQKQVIELCQKAISELDFNQFSNAKEALKLALTACQNIKQ